MKFDIFIVNADPELFSRQSASLQSQSDLINCIIPIDAHLQSSRRLEQIARQAATPYLFFLSSPDIIIPDDDMLRRFASIAESTGALMIYSDFRRLDENGIPASAPTIDYTVGSIRDDFDFGPMQCFSSLAVRRYVDTMDASLTYAALYGLRLQLSRNTLPLRIPEPLYTVIPNGCAASQFDYVDPRNRDRQIEMEAVATQHLKQIGAWLPPVFESPVDTADYPFEASVVIPVRNRATTIADAVGSALSQETRFPYNVIVVDNHSTDGTTETLKRIAAADSRLVVIVPESGTLGIGGCWDLAIRSPHCGRYAVQLDSDDLYSSPSTLQTIVDKFRQEDCAMVIGSYALTDFNLNTIPPGVIDHREWTPDNGRNNALRINGLGAPRAFMTGILRKIGVPNVSYGEDYALGLEISSRYRIGRIYDVLYLCRRWEGNSDASLPIEKINANNRYKDFLRSIAIVQRQRINQSVNPTC